MPKKSLGDKLRKWDVRFFVLTFDAIYYFKFEEDFLQGRPAKVRRMHTTELRQRPCDSAWRLALRLPLWLPRRG